ncbi:MULTISPECIES: DUF2303 family protein [unclassified Paraburkholderia]|uniref:DUF2303 family protein n=1 Tax=unclassified Paraburkholderia TaxID=2615204 RepID=UPI00161B5F22|nr:MULTISPECIES: DUF2303 family protein [unclassified Paraburkholderia]MBB5443256.1 uncharacterized protein YfdQ (DUF2303 family) [Paraburkholderia sp. WSM4177]MBB5483138.1 uncharacterized protein YfdQ (DUF2303 family) [Paraburkholderia sp. WSM4180]
MDDLQSNIAETLAREMKAPVEIGSNTDAAVRRIALPPDWTLKEYDDSKYRVAPLRKSATVRLRAPEDFIEYTKRHGSLTDSSIWCEADYPRGQVAFTAILNDHGEDEAKAAWRDHLARFQPEFSEEWKRWIGNNKQALTQGDFAAFIEENLKDITGPTTGENLPTGAEMLEMALAFEATQDFRFKSAVRLQNGGQNLSFVQDDDDQTLQKMKLFERFALGIPVFRNGDAYRIDARLRYRVRDAKLTFFYELIRFDKVLEAAATGMIATIRDQTGNPFFFGDPFAK